MEQESFLSLDLFMRNLKRKLITVVSIFIWRRGRGQTIESDLARFQAVMLELNVEGTGKAIWI